MDAQIPLIAALDHHRAGRLQEAYDLYRQVLREHPNHPEALHYLGLIAHQAGQNEQALNLIRRSIEINPASALYHYNLGLLLQTMGQLDPAAEAYRSAIAADPKYAEAHNGLGLAMHKMGRIDEALAAYRKAIALAPSLLAAQINLAGALAAAGRLDDAADIYRAILLQHPDHAEARNNLGGILHALGKPDEAIEHMRAAVATRPDYAEAHANLGLALYKRGQLASAIASCNSAIALRPDFARAHVNLADIFLAQGRLDEAVQQHVQAINLRPDSSTTHSTLLWMLHFHPAWGPAALADAHRQWAQRHAEPLMANIAPHPAAAPAGRLRIGYVSPDFREHPVGRLFEPVLRHHDTQKFEVFCYSDVARPDALTERLKGLAGTWRPCAGMSDAQLAKQIRTDRIDILVDLTLHMAGNRLLVFARKPAPVQITALGYNASTGLRTMDWRITDPHLEPADTLPWPEKPLILPETQWVYTALPVDAPPGELPALAAGHITFASLNNFAKVNAQTIAAWSRILHAVPDSRLLIVVEGGAAENPHIPAAFASHGIPHKRLELAGRQTFAEYLRLYGRIDIALDPWPYNGGTTTIDAAWMGVPVVSLAGQMPLARVGLSLMHNLGLSELVAMDEAQYITIAKDLALDPPRLRTLRRTLRDRLQSSPLMDAARFTRQLEDAYGRASGA